ncbi:T9SS type A sorting domain-containing protein [Polaribacter litorisediminis]|uniref:SdrD B-like domain-containing protein n=1 Tax=Polaribacter litorisediminis TaxID=1908341 RepID=UPI001CBB6FBA|nr:SdrD B-like domain-containing protein [Polaribacter litorisediminis]UAM98191.1 T9SS type A sorting domain-containing protein [Polaribacter litorisediminis]
MNYPTKTKLLLMLFLVSITSYNYANKHPKVNEFISLSSEKEIDVSFYDSYKANWENLANLSSQFEWNSDNFAEILKENLKLSAFDVVKTENVSSKNSKDSSNQLGNLQLSEIVDPCDAALSGNLDSDLDGIADICDLDDDNDGILDTDESEVCSGDTNSLDIRNNFGFRALSSDDNGTYPTTLAGINYSIIFDENGTSIASLNLSKPDEHGPVFNFGGKHNDEGSIDITFSEAISGVKFKLADFDEAETVTVEAYDQNNNLVNLSGSGYIAAIGSQVGQNGNVFEYTSGGNVDGDSMTTDSLGAVTFDFNGISIKRVKVSILHSRGSSIRYTMMNGSFCILTDTDKDNIPDSLDTDSDNDGCPDALEGSGTNITTANLDANNRIIGGVNDNGIPILAATSLTAGQGTSAAVTTAEQIVVNANPVSQTLGTGDDLIFSVDANAFVTTIFNAGIPNYGAGSASSLTYKWFKNTDVNTIISTASALTINNITAADAGDYTVQIIASNKCTEERSATLSINNPPVNTVPGPQTTQSNTDLNIAGVSVTDVDGNLATVQLSVTNGTLDVVARRDVTVVVNAPGSITLSGTEANINAVLSTLIYVPNLNFNGSDTLTVVSSDNGVGALTDTDSFLINVVFGGDPCDATASGNLDTDGDNISDICDLDDDNDGILDINEGCFVKTTDFSAFSINRSSHTASLNSASNGFGIDITRLDNSFSILVNGSPLFSGEIELAGAFTPLPQSIVFTDGARFGASGIPQIWAIGTANAATPLIRLIVSPSGDVQFFGSRTLNGALEPMVLANGMTVNPITWNATNTIEIDQLVNGPTYAVGTIYGYNNTCADTDDDGIPNNLDLDSDNDGCADSLEGSAVNILAGNLDANGQITGAVSVNGIPTLATITGQASTTAVVTAEQITVDIAPTDSSVGQGSNASFSVSASGVETTTFNAGIPDYSAGSSSVLSYNWFKNSDPNTILSNSNTLSLNNVSAGDIGDYTVVISGLNNSCVLEETATLTLNSGSIGNTVWYDTDGDGIVDAGEPGLVGATVTLDPGTQGDPSDDVTTTTDVNGNYLFSGLPSGDYIVTVDVRTVTGGIPTGFVPLNLVQAYDADGLNSASKSYVSLGSGETNLDQNFGWIVPSGVVSGGNSGGVESESLGDAISKIYVGRKKNSVPTEFVKSSENVFNKKKMKSSQPYQGKGQTLLDMFPAELVAGNVANVTSPTDILDYTVADEVLSVDFSVDGETKGVVLGIKTSDKIYNHTKASCDRLRGAEILNIQKIEIGGYNFLMQGIKQRNGIVEYAVSFATAKNNNDANYTIQTNWYVNAYTKFNDVYNFQVWSTRPEDTQKMVADILENLNSFIPVEQPEVQKFPKTYASKIYREKGELVVALRSTEVGKTAEVNMVELYSETANNIKFRDNAVSTEIQQSLRLDIADGYEYDALIKVNDEVEDAFYHADGNWGLDYDKRYTEVLNYFVWNNFEREYGDDEYTINRDVELKATSEYDYLTLYKSLLPGTISADYSEYQYVAFTAKGSGLMELGLIKSSIEDWKAQYRIMVDFSEEERTYYVPFDVFTSSASQENMTAEDLTTLTFTFLPVEAQTKELDLKISNVRFTKTAVESQTVQKIEKFENEFMAYPNPSKGNVNLLLFSETDTEATVTLSDITGKVIYRGKAQLTAGKNELEFDFKVKTGVMLLQVNSAEVNYGTSKVVFR